MICTKLHSEEVVALGRWPVSVCLGHSQSPLQAKQHCVWSKLLASVTVAFLSHSWRAPVTCPKAEATEGLVLTEETLAHCSVNCFLHSDQGHRGFRSILWHCSWCRNTQFLIKLSSGQQLAAVSVPAHPHSSTR